MSRRKTKSSSIINKAKQKDILETSNIQRSTKFERDVSEVQRVGVSIDRSLFVSFKYIDQNKYTPKDCSLAQIRNLFPFFQKLEGFSWNQVHSYHGLGYKMIDQSVLPDLPKTITPDVTIFELRVTAKERVFCFRDQNICNFIWFDPDHEILPG